MNQPPPHHNPKATLHSDDETTTPARASAARAAAHEHLSRVVTLNGISVSQVMLPEHRDVIVGGIRLHYLDWGTAGRMPVVFLHGGGLSAHTWDVVCLALRDEYHCLALDQRGHGDSEWSPACDYSLDAHLRDLEGFLHHLGAAPVFLVGQSLGGINAIRYASRHPARLAGLVVIDVGPYVRQRAGVDRIVEFALGPGVFDSIEEAVARAVAFNPRRDPQLLRYSLTRNLRRLPDGRLTWKHDRRHLSSRRYDHFVAQIQALAPETRAITCPTLVVRGAESDVFSDEEAADFASLVADGRRVTVERSGHNVQGDNPAGLLDALRPFLGAHRAQ